LFYLKISFAGRVILPANFLLIKMEVDFAGASSDFEGFALQKVCDVLPAIWADCGLDAKPAQIFRRRFDLQSDAFLGKATSAFLKVPYSTASARTTKIWARRFISIGRSAKSNRAGNTLNLYVRRSLQS